MRWPWRGSTPVLRTVRSRGPAKDACPECGLHWSDFTEDDYEHEIEREREAGFRAGLEEALEYLDAHNPCHEEVRIGIVERLHRDHVGWAVGDAAHTGNSDVGT